MRFQCHSLFAAAKSLGKTARSFSFWGPLQLFLFEKEKGAALFKEVFGLPRMLLKPFPFPYFRNDLWLKLPWQRLIAEIFACPYCPSLSCAPYGCAESYKLLYRRFPDNNCR